MRGLRRALRLAVLGALLAGGVWIARLDARVRAYLAGPPLGATRVYGAPTMLRPGMATNSQTLARMLTRLGYRAVDDVPRAGEFRATRGVVELAQRPSPAPWAPAPQRARVVFTGDMIAGVADANGAAVDHLELEPEVLAVLGRQGPTLDAGREEAPPACRAAVISAEDHHFYQHPGIDPIAVVRALLTNLRAGASVQGGSTLTQQLAKNTFLSPRRTIARKAVEAVYALLLEARTTKEDVLRRYLASVYLGVDNGLPLHGFAQGADVYFGKPLGELDAAECALLAGLIRSPNRLGPRRHARAAVARRNDVLAAMASEGFLDAAAWARARVEPLRLAAPKARPGASLYVAAEVARTLPRLLTADEAQAPGLAVFTGIDPRAQRSAERAVARGIESLERVSAKRRPLEAALVALDPLTADVRALVGGRHYGTSPLDRAVRSRRQVGSTFKPFVYLAALDPTRHDDGRRWTVVSTLDDEPVTVRVGARTWRPDNYEGDFAGPVPLEDALAQSRNAATVRLALDVGMEAVARAASDAGIDLPPPHVPALALGAGESSLIELTGAYAVFAAGGIRRAPTLIAAIATSTGETLYVAPREETRVFTPGVSYLVTHLLERVVDTGTARSARTAGLAGPAAGKTGTTDETRDAWFVGFTPDVVAGVWVGKDDARPTGLTGAQGALPIWTEFVQAVATGEPATAFPVPDDIVWREIDPASGALATSGCSQRERVPFLTGTEPTQDCPLHRPLWTSVEKQVTDGVRAGGRVLGSGGQRMRDWFRRLFH